MLIENSRVCIDSNIGCFGTKNVGTYTYKFIAINNSYHVTISERLVGMQPASSKYHYATASFKYLLSMNGLNTTGADDKKELWSPCHYRRQLDFIFF